jgi:predicted nuclease with TOPRIM domain
MSEDTTRNFPSSFEERVLSELAAINTRMGSLETRLTSLEDKVDARLRETRPIWESVQAQLKEIEKELVKFNRQFKTLLHDLFDLRVRVEKLEDSQPLD